MGKARTPANSGRCVNLLDLVATGGDQILLCVTNLINQQTSGAIDKRTHW